MTENKEKENSLEKDWMTSRKVITHNVLRVQRKWSGLFLLFGKVLQAQKSSKQPQIADRPFLFENRLKMTVKDDREYF